MSAPREASAPLPNPDSVDTPPADAPVLHDLVTIRHGLEPYEQRSGVIIDIYRQPHMVHGDRFRVEFRDGTTDWYWTDELTLEPFTEQRRHVIAHLGATRITLFQALSAAADHDVFHAKLSDIFDTLTATAARYLGVGLDGPPRRADSGDGASGVER
ncbi:hypothetical protein [Micromonospora zamorensis]|uniref:hypothetical protein n=1 Tax=Micromonospora zamorensis TaxID=709883 RepID=UPI0033B8CC49